MEPVITIDASKQYSQGQELQVVSDGTFGLYKIQFKDNKGLVPDILSGSYTHADFAARACEQYLALRDSVFEVKVRKAAVKKGKEEHAAKKAAQVEEA